MENSISRKRFEEWVTGFPFERDISRWPEEEDKYQWPGDYKDIAVSLAWAAYIEGEGSQLVKLKSYIVCGGRDFSDWRLLQSKLNVLLETELTFRLVHGDARGADKLAAGWGEYNSVIVEAYPADWERYGKAAGHIRNRQMLDSGVDGVIAFAGGRGTANTVEISQRAGIPVWDLRGEK